MVVRKMKRNRRLKEFEETVDFMVLCWEMKFVCDG